MKRFLIGLVIVVAAAAVAFFLGPKVDTDTTITFDPATIGSDPETYLATSEGAVEGIVHDLHKEIIWAYPQSKAKTPLAIVYVHGFSASKEEVRPLPDIVAAELGANLYYARLTGHGRNGDALMEGGVNAWVNDLAEAVAIGEMLGEKVIVMGTSTGGSLATWGAGQTRLTNKIAGLIIFSPIYGYQHPLAGLATGPWGAEIAEMAEGKVRRFEPSNEDHGKYWTHEYPTRAGLPVLAVAKLAREAAVENVKIPALFIFSPGDRVVDTELTKSIAKRWGGPSEIVEVNDSEDPYDHVIAGRILSPNTTEPLAQRCIEWIRKIVQ